METKKENYQDTINYLKNKYTNIQTYCKHISLILRDIRNEEPVNEFLQTVYRNELGRCKMLIEELPKKSFDKELQLEKLRKIWSERNIIDRNALITGLYLFIPALRSDYTESFIKDNFIYITLSKINKGVVVTREIPNELKSLLHLYNTLPKSHNSFTNTLSLASKRIFNKNITINTYRRIWTEFGIRTMTVQEQKHLAFLMNHSWNIHMKEYTPLMEIVYK